MIFRQFAANKELKNAAAALYGHIVAQARQPAFYRDGGVPDTVDGRFEMILLHTYVVLRRLRDKKLGHPDLAQKLFDRLFDDMDRSLREMGTGDLRVGSRVKEMAEAFYGRIRAYDIGLDDDPVSLNDALLRNLFRDPAIEEKHVERLAAYLRQEVLASHAWELTALLSGRVTFGINIAEDAE